ncbi:ankyrin repeat domain-containing protein [Gemella morbillorum]|uniref:ankyrin repeat domain-containing protein n=1 Tax=Gemella morbillorum TaxID=29391 RepID=UPI0018D4DC6B|nr:ankyrin repeat domain-containing protein [Gemella morbillorum]
MLFELGADVERVDRYGNSPLHTAASFFHPNTVRFLVEKGANVYLKNDMDQTPLASCLAVCSNLNIPEVAEIADILLQAGDKVTLDMIESVRSDIKMLLQENRGLKEEKKQLDQYKTKGKYGVK